MSDIISLNLYYNIFEDNTYLNNIRINNNNYEYIYTLFYNNLFKNKKDEKLDIAIVGIQDISLLLMWKDFFIKSNIYGFDNKNIDDLTYERIFISYVNINKNNEFKNVLFNLNINYDIIIENTTNFFIDQIKIIINIYNYLKPGGILIIENVLHDEIYYIQVLNTLFLKYLQDYYFITLEKVKSKSKKMLILIKSGAEFIFKNNNTITIITPSYRIENLTKIKDSINFDYIDEWIIIYDGTKIDKKSNIFINDNNDKIKEYTYNNGDKGFAGAMQRNYAFTKITNPNTFIYYLDDDNIIHPNLYKLFNIIENNKMYTFNQKDRMNGNIIAPCFIDTAMILIDYNICKNVEWKAINLNDGYYIQECFLNNIENFIYVDNDLCYYNKLNQ